MGAGAAEAEDGTLVVAVEVEVDEGLAAASRAAGEDEFPVLFLLEAKDGVAPEFTDLTRVVSGNRVAEALVPPPPRFLLSGPSLLCTCFPLPG